MKAREYFQRADRDVVLAPIVQVENITLSTDRDTGLHRIERSVSHEALDESNQLTITLEIPRFEELP